MLEQTLDKLTAQELTDLIKQVLLAYHSREQNRLEEILSSLEVPDKLHETWPEFVAHFQDKKEALTYFTQYIQAQLDGGECVIPQ
jgi:iron-sulfur cluster repair protein YtfE (RIC family)